MKPQKSGKPAPLGHDRAGVPKFRSVPPVYRKSFVIAVCAACLHYLCIIGAITTGGILFYARNEETCYIMLAFLAASIITGIISFLTRRCARCPLCKGTPLIHTGAIAHQVAFRVPPFNHATTATLNILCSQRFRCMYCGSRFDLHKRGS